MRCGKLFRQENNFLNSKMKFLFKKSYIQYSFTNLQSKQNKMICTASLLSASRNGKVYYCNVCNRKLMLMFGNISTSFSEESFKNFSHAIHDIGVDEYFREFKNEFQVHIRTQLDYLFYSFSYSEIIELRKLLDDGYLRYKIQIQLESQN